MGLYISAADTDCTAADTDRMTAEADRMTAEADRTAAAHTPGLYTPPRLGVVVHLGRRHILPDYSRFHPGETHFLPGCWVLHVDYRDPYLVVWVVGVRCKGACVSVGRDRRLLVMGLLMNEVRRKKSRTPRRRKPWVIYPWAGLSGEA